MPDAATILEGLPYGVVVVDGHQQIVAANATARRLLPALSVHGDQRCHDLLPCTSESGPCRRACLARNAARAGKTLPEVRVDTALSATTSALWLTAAPIHDDGWVVLHMRPGEAGDRRRRTEPHWLEEPALRIDVLGRTAVTSGALSLGGQWLQERPGGILKYMVCHRHGVAYTEQLAETFWPGSRDRALGNIRHSVHRLRSKLEPARADGESAFIRSVSDGYALDRMTVVVDADEFETAVNLGLAAFHEADTTTATAHLEQAMRLYRAEFLADEPYAEWAQDERARLAQVAVRALRMLVILATERSDPTAAIEHLERLCALEPLDSGVNRDLVAALRAAGRRSDAKRHYMAFARRLRREFGEEPDFDLQSLAGG